MTDANKYYLDKREAEQEEYDFKDEYEEIAADNVRLEAEVKKYHDAWLEAEAQVVDLEAQVEGCLAVIATERDEVLALRRKLEEEREAVDALASAFGCECKGKAACVLAQIISEYQMRKSLEGRKAR